MSTPVSRESALTAAFIDIADTMVDNYDLVEMAHRVCRHSVDLLDVAAAGLMLADGRGRLALLASSNEQAQLIELFQLQAEGEGPCLECFRTGRPVTAVNLSTLMEQWGEFAIESQRLGFQTVHALPMLLRDHTIGTLNLFRINNSPLAGQDLALGQALADLATISILQERALAKSETVVEQLQGALNSRVIIEQAKGVLSNLGKIDIDEAFRVLRRYARTHNMLLAELARTVTTDHTQAREVLDYTHRC